MNNCELYHELMNVKAHLHDIKNFADDIDAIDAVTKAQYAVQDTMMLIIDELLEFVSSRCYQRSRTSDVDITDETETQYIAGEDKTIVWRRLYVNGEPIVEELTGWYHGEPDEKTTKDYCNSMHTAYFMP